MITAGRGRACKALPGHPGHSPLALPSDHHVVTRSSRASPAISDASRPADHFPRREADAGFDLLQETGARGWRNRGGMERFTSPFVRRTNAPSLFIQPALPSLCGSTHELHEQSESSAYLVRARPWVIPHTQVSASRCWVWSRHDHLDMHAWRITPMIRPPSAPVAWKHPTREARCGHANRDGAVSPPPLGTSMAIAIPYTLTAGPGPSTHNPKHPAYYHSLNLPLLHFAFLSMH